MKTTHILLMVIANFSSPLLHAADFQPPSEIKKLSSRGDIDGIAKLLSQGVDINSTMGAFHGTALIWAKNEKVTEFLLQHGANPKARDSRNISALMEAARNGNIEQAKILLKSGLNINDKEDSGRSSIHFSIGNLNPEFTRFLLESGGYPDVQDSKGMTPLMLAMNYAEIDQVIVLLEFGANTRLKNSDGKTAIELLDNSNPAAQPQDIEKIKKLLNEPNRVPVTD